MGYFRRGKNAPVALDEVHHCVVVNRPSLIHHPLLPLVKSRLFKRLQQHARKLGYQLLADRRSRQPSPGQQNPNAGRRKNWVRVLTLVALLGQSTTGYCDSLSQQLQALDSTAHQTPRHAFVPNTATLAALGQNQDQLQGSSRGLEEILLHHWRPTENDPPDLKRVFGHLAQYFSQFQSTRQLLGELDRENWFIEYRQNQFSSDVHGGQSRVDSVTVYFDPNSAGQFKFHKTCDQKLAHCIAAPADLFLHELLHTYLALKRPQEFIRDGGMSPVMYPYRHEQRTIALEQRFYRTMTLIDQAPRPRRTDHVGRPLSVSCITCLQ